MNGKIYWSGIVKLLFIAYILLQSYHTMAGNNEKNKGIGLQNTDCDYLFEVNIENNSTHYKNWDLGYTHGNIIAIHKKCASGTDTTFKIESKMFIFGTYRSFSQGKLTFTEENRAIIEKNNWRDFSNKFYFARGLLIGLVSSKNRFLAGKQVEWYHEIFQSDIIPVYKFYAIDREEGFIGIPLGIGKAFSLNESNTVCPANQCTDYVKAETGLELVTLDKASYLYVHSEISKNIPLTEKWPNLLSVYLSAKVKTIPSETDLYGYGSAGMRLFFDLGTVDLSAKQRYVPDNDNWYIKEDLLNDTLVSFTITFPFSIQ